MQTLSALITRGGYEFSKVLGCRAIGRMSSASGDEIRLGSQHRPAPDLRSLSEADLKSLAIKLERTRCYGTCPAYVVTIHGDGRVEYDGKAHVKETGTRRECGHRSSQSVGVGVRKSTIRGNCQRIFGNQMQGSRLHGYADRDHGGRNQRNDSPHSLLWV